MLIVTYTLSIILFCVASLILPLFLMPIVSAIKRKDTFVTPTDPLFLTPFIVSTVVLLYLTRAIWSSWGYDPGWLFPTIIAVLHFIMGGLKGANQASQAQAYGVVFGVVVYAVSRLF
jgi:hypothetical protein